MIIKLAGAITIKAIRDSKGDLDLYMSYRNQSYIKREKPRRRNIKALYTAILLFTRDRSARNMESQTQKTKKRLAVE
jgi:hypothetical protein